MKRRATALMMALTLSAGVTAGCGGGDESSGSGDSNAQGAPSEAPQGAPAGIEEFQSCLEDQGVDLPEPGSGEAPPPGQNLSAESQKALEACQDKLPDGFGPGNAPDVQPQ